MQKIIDELYITTCGRIFNKKSPYRTIKSFEVIPTLSCTFYRFIKRNNLKKEDFIITDSGLRNNSNSKLYFYKYKINTPLYYELHGIVDDDGYKILKFNKKFYKWHRIVCYKFKPIDNYQQLQVNHINGNKMLNSINNLEWCTCKENIHHAINNNLRGIMKQYEHITLDDILNKNCKIEKYIIKKILKKNNCLFKDYIFIKTDIINNKEVGYLKKK